LTKVPGTHSGERTVSSINGVFKKVDIYMQRTKLDPYLTPHTKWIHPKCIKDLSVRPETTNY
jgi:hypothetical protein